MKRRSALHRAARWLTILGAGAAVLVVIGFFLLVYFTTVGLFFSSEMDPNKVLYTAETTVDDCKIHVTLYRLHPFLAEYRKVLQINRKGKQLIEKEFIDSGGLASFYFLRQGNRIVIVDGVLEGFALEPSTGTITDVDRDLIPKDFDDTSFGRFMFGYDAQGQWQYGWVARKESDK